jgi:hypothetical protein
MLFSYACKILGYSFYLKIEFCQFLEKFLLTTNFFLFSCRENYSRADSRNLNCFQQNPKFRKPLSDFLQEQLL